MIRSLSNSPVHTLFSPDNNIVYSIPKYQREYSWGVSQWDELFDDLVDAGEEGEHFLGTIICVNNTRDTTNESVLEVIDGQQRLTTLSLFLTAIYSILHENEDSLTKEERKAFYNLESMLTLSSPARPRLRPQSQNSNAADFELVLHEAHLEVPRVNSPYSGIRRIKKAYVHFRNRLEKIAEELKQETYQASLEFLGRIKRATMVKIEVETQADAFVLFESLNNRGMPLTPIDLIKNTLLGHADRAQKLDNTYEQWSEWVDVLGDDYSTQERFFRYFYNAMKEEKQLTVQGATIATRTSLIKIYETLMSKDLDGLLEKITEGVRAYGVLIGNTENIYSQRVHHSLKRLSRAQGSPAHILLLYLLIMKEEISLNDDELYDISNLLTAFFVRRNLTGTPATYGLPKLFIEIIQKLRQHPVTERKEIILSSLKAVSASDDAFLEILKGPVYELNSDVVRFILVTLAENKMTKETEQDLWLRDGTRGKPVYRWSIEHVLPQSGNLLPDWVAMLGGDIDQAQQLQETHKHKLGNLTITGYNSSLGKKSFLDKRDHKDSNGRFIGYKNGLSLNEELAQKDCWTVNDIIERTNMLAEQTLAAFALGYR